MASFEINRNPIQGRSDVAVIRPSGVIDTHTLPSVETSLHELMESGCRYMVIDASLVRFISSSGIGVLMGALADLEKLGGKMILVAIEGKELFGTFKVLGLLRVFPTYASVSEALQQL